MKNTWGKESHKEKGVRRRLYSEDPNDPHTYQSVFSTDLKNKLKQTHDEWRKAGQPGGTFRVLDLGAGRGKAIKQMLEDLGKHESVLFVRHNLFMEDFGKHDRGKRAIAKATKLPFKNDSFHFVISACAIPYARDKLKVVKEVYRVLHPTGWAGLHLHSGIRKESVTENGKKIHLTEWLQKHGLKHEKKGVPWGVSSFSFGKGIALPETRVVSSKEETIAGVTIPPHHLISHYEVVE